MNSEFHLIGHTADWLETMKPELAVFVLPSPEIPGVGPDASAGVSELRRVELRHWRCHVNRGLSLTIERQQCGNRILILEHAYYSVISPEGCAAILWKDRAFSDKAAEALKITGPDLIKLKLADEVIPEPKGGAHSDPAAAAANIKSALLKHLDELGALSAGEIMQERYDKFRAMGAFSGSGRGSSRRVARPRGARYVPPSVTLHRNA